MIKTHEPLTFLDTTGESFPPEVEVWLKTPFAVHFARWKREIAEGLRDCEGVSDDEPTPATSSANESDSAELP